VVGPGNSVGGDEGVRLDLIAEATIHGNFFGVDPVTGARYANGVGVRIPFNTSVHRLEVHGNVFAGLNGLSNEADVSDISFVCVADNRFEHREAPEAAWEGVGIRSVASAVDGRFIVGPTNTFVRFDEGISISGQGGSASITSNRIQAKKPIVVEDPAVAPPTITRANATSVEGTCPVDGLIEIFVDPAQMAGQYVGQVLCLGSTWRYDGMLTDAYVTATLTTLDGTSVLAQHHSVR
jgi:hypothetical protein